MKVKCILLTNSFNEETNYSPWLEIGKSYIVVSIFINEHGEKAFGIIPTGRPIDINILSSHSSKCFDILSTTIPSSWSPWIVSNSSIGISPKSWQEQDFMDRLLDGDNLALNLFKKECEAMIAEEV